ncbi:hypothetical protein SKAU_G00003020 [Synaphobranchus kaupii]|uniref:Uncharacterized protein n=1 Tax=Synaphobranchus kaupii TaxID=118154 RepID=A0A9Q1G9Q3_SYNKA|nr:hypothetical protein SKAU_G00003020 [Synaphobranchus kaupii]
MRVQACWEKHQDPQAGGVTLHAHQLRTKSPGRWTDRIGRLEVPKALLSSGVCALLPSALRSSGLLPAPMAPPLYPTAAAALGPTVPDLRRGWSVRPGQRQRPGQSEARVERTQESVESKKVKAFGKRLVSPPRQH